MSDWTVQWLKNICSFSYGKNLPTANLMAEGFPVYGANGVIGFYSSFNAEFKTVLVSCRGEYSGKINLSSGKAFITNNSIPIKILSNHVDTLFLYYSLTQIPSSKIVSGSAQPQVTVNDLKKLQIHLPPLPQQRKIARILTTIDNLIEKTEALITKYQSIKQGLMHDLFTRGVDANGKLRPPQAEAPELYKQSELGWIPKEWEVGKIGDIACLIGGFAFSSSLVTNTGIRWLKIANVGFEEIVWDEISYLPERLLVEQHGFVLKSGEIVMAMTRPIIRGKLKVSFVQKHDTPSFLNQRVGKLVVHNLDDKHFAYFAIQFSETVQQLELKMLGTDPPNLSSSHIESVKLSLPSPSERKILGNLIVAINTTIKKEIQSLSFYRSLKTSLMQDLLTGQVQVTPDAVDMEPAHE